MEYTGQCVGGPDHGNLITATVTMPTFAITTERYLDGLLSTPSVVTIQGQYVWNPEVGVFNWRFIGERQGSG
jgi:hypothetical protein